MTPSRLFTFAVSVFTVGALSFNAQADEYGVEYSRLAESIRKAQTHCSDASDCQMAELETKVLFDSSSHDTPLKKDQIAKLKDIAFNQAQIWADTILEGDYEVSGKTELDLVEGVYRGSDIVAYRITYSEHGWYTGACNYDYENKSTLAECQEGRIVESSFVSPEMTAWIRDDFAYADFYE